MSILHSPNGGCYTQHVCDSTQQLMCQSKLKRKFRNALNKLPGTTSASCYILYSAQFIMYFRIQQDTCNCKKKSTKITSCFKTVLTDKRCQYITKIKLLLYIYRKILMLFLYIDNIFNIALVMEINKINHFGLNHARHYYVMYYNLIFFKKQICLINVIQ